MTRRKKEVGKKGNREEGGNRALHRGRRPPESGAHDARRRRVAQGSVTRFPKKSLTPFGRPRTQQNPTFRRRRSRRWIERGHRFEGEGGLRGRRPRGPKISEPRRSFGQGLPMGWTMHAPALSASRHPAEFARFATARATQHFVVDGLRSRWVAIVPGATVRPGIRDRVRVDGSTERAVSSAHATAAFCDVRSRGERTNHEGSCPSDWRIRG